MNEDEEYKQLNNRVKQVAQDLLSFAQKRKDEIQLKMDDYADLKKKAFTLGGLEKELVAREKELLENQKQIDKDKEILRAKKDTLDRREARIKEKASSLQKYLNED